MDVVRVVIECTSKPPHGHEYRVWTEHNGEVRDEVPAVNYVTAVAALMDKIEGPDLAAFEPVFA